MNENNNTEAAIELYHTSPTEVLKIHSEGKFGQFLFFAAEEYVMTAGNHITYSIKIDENEIIEAGQLFYHPDAAKLDGLVNEVKDLMGCNTETAENMLAQKDDPGEAEKSWNIQGMTGRAAVILGFRGVSMQDEQGTSYLVAMCGHESELTQI